MGTGDVQERQWQRPSGTCIASAPDPASSGHAWSLLHALGQIHGEVRDHPGRGNHLLLRGGRREAALLAPDPELGAQGLLPAAD